MKPLQKIRLFLATLFVLTAGFVWGWVLWPSPYSEKTIALPEIQSSGSQYTNTVTFLNSLGLQAKVKYPVRVHTGDTAVIRVDLQSLNAQTGMNLDAARDQAMIEARIDLPLTQVSPPGRITETFSSDVLPHFVWQISSLHAGQLSGQLWMYALITAEGEQTDRQALLAVPFEIATNSLFGLPDTVLTWAALGLTIAGLLLMPLSVFMSVFTRQQHPPDTL